MTTLFENDDEAARHFAELILKDPLSIMLCSIARADFDQEERLRLFRDAGTSYFVPPSHEAIEQQLLGSVGFKGSIYGLFERLLRSRLLSLHDAHILVHGHPGYEPGSRAEHRAISETSPFTPREASLLYHYLLPSSRVLIDEIIEDLSPLFLAKVPTMEPSLFQLDTQ